MAKKVQRTVDKTKKKRWSLAGVVTVSVTTTVEAETLEEAKAIALNERAPQSLCAQCNGRDEEVEWVLCDGLDSDVELVDDPNAHTEVK